MTAIFNIDECDDEFSKEYTENIFSLSSHAVSIDVAVYQPGAKDDMTLVETFDHEDADHGLANAPSSTSGAVR